MESDTLAALERAAIAQGPPGAAVVGASIRPDGAYGATLTFLPSANYLMDEVFDRSGESWVSYTAGSGGGISWTTLGDDDGGVLRFGHEAPEGSSTARVIYEQQEHRVPVRHGHFLLVVWDTAFREDPVLIAFE